MKSTVVEVFGCAEALADVVVLVQCVEEQESVLQVGRQKESGQW